MVEVETAVGSLELLFSPLDPSEPAGRRSLSGGSSGKSGSEDASNVTAKFEPGLCTSAEAMTLR